MKSSSRRYRIGFALVFSIFLYWLVLSIPGDPTVAVRGHNRTRNNQVGEPHLTRGPISAFAEASVSSSDPEASEKVRKAYRRLPLRFERNLGQLDESVKFVHRGARYTLLLKATAAEMILDRATTSRSINDFKRKTLTDKYPSAKETTPTLLRMSLIGSDPEARVSGIGELASKTHYFAGSDPKRWRTNIPAYGRVLCEQVYPGIDLIYYGNQSRLEYDFEVAPGSDPESILWKIDGAETTEIDSAGDVVIRTQNGPVRLDKPKIYQESEGIRHPVSGRYVKRGESHIGFEIDSYDASLALTIDPVIQYATYLGGGGIDIPWSIVLDSAGAALITGQSNSIPRQSRGL